MKIATVHAFYRDFCVCGWFFIGFSQIFTEHLEDADIRYNLLNFSRTTPGKYEFRMRNNVVILVQGGGALGDRYA